DSALAGVLFRWATDDAARESLARIGQSVAAAQAETPPSEQPSDEMTAAASADTGTGSPAIVTAAKEKVQQFLLSLLDRSLEKLGSGV
ncbi:hypothetical protein NPN16_24135, partial [Vibrio parahaemolyticus]|uniref:hypothetical protein n=1 Tax=Vibrio parahaemolyticus TaxID=670 RepID=UPI002111DC9F